MNLLLLLLIILVLAVINVFLWKYGFVHDAENPRPFLDRPVMDARERKAIKKRLKRWSEEGKLTRNEFDRFSDLCDQEWDQKGKGSSLL